MKILVTGSNGMLANSVKDRFKMHELICTDVNELDITDENAVINKVYEIKPEYIINCAAYTAVDRAEEDYDLAYKINSIGPKNLAIAAKKSGAILVHISTDYVFDGDLSLDKMYVEEDSTNPVTVYGKTKLSGENEIIKITDRYYIFRTAWLYGKGNNFVRTMLKLGSSKEEINVVSDQYGSPTNADDLADIIYQAIEKKIPFGIYHSTNLGFTTWYEFTKKIFEIANISCKVNPVTTDEYIKIMNIVQAKRPHNSRLSKDKILKEGIVVPNWEDSLKKYLEIYVNY